MRKVDDFEYTYSSWYDGNFETENEWLDYLSPNILEAYNEQHTFDQYDQEDY